MPAPAACPAASANASRSLGRSHAIRRSCSSTSLSPHSTRTPRSRCEPSCSSSWPVSSFPTLLVTHDFEDAAALAGHVGVLVDGRLRQAGSPADLVARPADPFVASFTGANLLHGRRERNGETTHIRLDDGTLITSSDECADDGVITVAVYPWDITLATAPPHDSAQNLVSGRISGITELGNRARVTLGPISAEITVDSLRRLGLQPGQHAYASFKATGTRIVASKGETG